MKTSETIGALAKALRAAQAEMDPAVKDATNPHLRNRYADLGSVWDAARGPLQAHGLAVLQGAAQGPDGSWHLTTRLVHESGEWAEGAIPLIYGDAKGMTPMQSLGSAISYARRYGLSAIVSLMAEDDDGHAAGGRQDDRPRQQPQANGRQAEGPTLDAFLNLAIDSWHAFDPVRDDDDMKARKWRLINAACTAMVKAEEIDPRTVQADEPDEDGAYPRDRKKVWNALVRLYRAKPVVVGDAIKAHVASKRTTKAEAN